MKSYGKVVRGEKAPHGLGNRLLDCLPHAEFKRLFAGVEPVTLEFGEVLHEPGARIRHVYFPINAVVALLTTATGHKAVKVALVGNEGVVGIPLALGIDTSSSRALVQGTGVAIRMESALFRAEVLRSQPLQQALFQFKHALTGQIAQSAACKQFHSVQARLARYLLMTGDRARSIEFCLTQEFIADMLGVRRPSITIAGNSLRRRALIKTGRGRITILDQKRLGAASCECYQAIKGMYARAYANS